MAHSSGNSIADIYKGVISDVISQVKEAFLDEGVDIDVLHQLKKEWEEKVTASGCVDFDGTGRQGAGGGRNVKQMPSQARSSGQSNSQSSQQQQRAAAQQPQATTTHIQQVQYLGGPGNNIPLVQNLHTIPGTHLSQGAAAAQAVLPTGAIAFATAPSAPGGSATTVRMVAPHAGQYAIMQSAGGHPGMQQGIMLLSTGGQQIPGVVTVTTGNLVPVQARLAPVKSEPGVHQLDGAAAPLAHDDIEEVIIDDQPSSSHFQASGSRFGAKQMPKQAVAQKQPAPLKKKKPIVIQVDGPGGVSDSSSDEDIEEEEDDDPLRRIVDRIGEGENGEDEEQSVEDDPLNSGDDQSDDEDIDTLFDADNVVMCQFEKVHRARARWKFTLKDGIMHIQGKDYVFQKATGEAEW